MMPWHIYEGQQSILIGEAQNLQLANEFLNDLGFYPLLTSNGLPIVTVGSINYVDGAAGSYNELYVSFLASKSPPLS